MLSEFILIGDPHIEGLHSLFPNFAGDTDDFIYKAFDTVAEYAGENGIENAIILGDIFHSPNPTQASQKRFLRWISSTSINWYAISGNHDWTIDGEHSLVMSSFAAEMSEKINIKFYTKPTVEKIDGVNFCFLPWPEKKSLLKGNGINIAHITLKGAKGDAGKALTHGEEIDEPDQPWYIGDLHTHQRMGKKVCYPGTMYQRTFGEKLPKGFIHLKVKHKKDYFKVTDEFIITPPPYELVNLRIDTLDDLEKLEYTKSKVVQYKLKIYGDVALPPNLRLDFPNIVDIEYKRKGMIVSSKTGKPISIKGITDPLQGLDKLLEKEGLTEEEVKRGMKIAQGYVKELDT